MKVDVASISSTPEKTEAPPKEKEEDDTKGARKSAYTCRKGEGTWKGNKSWQNSFRIKANWSLIWFF